MRLTFVGVLPVRDRLVLSGSGYEAAKRGDEILGREDPEVRLEARVQAALRAVEDSVRSFVVHHLRGSDVRPTHIASEPLEACVIVGGNRSPWQDAARSEPEAPDLAPPAQAG